MCVCQGVLYWMWRDKRVQDNWALLYSQQVATKLNVPLQVRTRSGMYQNSPAGLAKYGTGTYIIISFFTVLGFVWNSLQILRRFWDPCSFYTDSDLAFC